MDNLTIHYHFDVLRELRDDMIDPTATAALDFAIKICEKNLPKKDFRQFLLYKDDEYIAQGTISELASLVGVKFETMRYYASNAHYERIEKIKSKGNIRKGTKFYRAIMIEEDD